MKKVGKRRDIYTSRGPVRHKFVVRRTTQLVRTLWPDVLARRRVSTILEIDGER